MRVHPLLLALPFLLAVQLLGACAAPPVPPIDAGQVSGTIRPGGSLGGWGPHGLWSVELRGSDLLIDVGAARAVFRDAATEGAVAYRLDDRRMRGAFALAPGEVRWNDLILEVGERRYVLLESHTLVFPPGEARGVYALAPGD